VEHQDEQTSEQNDGDGLQNTVSATTSSMPQESPTLTAVVVPGQTVGNSQQTQYVLYAVQPGQPIPPQIQIITPAPTVPETVHGSGMATAAMVLGICSIPFASAFFVALPAALIGIILAGVSIKKKVKRHKQAVAGLVTSIIGLLASLAALAGTLNIN